MAAVSVKRSIHRPNVAYCNHIRRFERFHFHRMHSLRQKYLGHFLWTPFFFCFSPISFPSQFCLSQLTHEILYTNVGRARRQNVSDNFDRDLQQGLLEYIQTRSQSNCSLLSTTIKALGSEIGSQDATRSLQICLRRDWERVRVIVSLRVVGN